MRSHYSSIQTAQVMPKSLPQYLCPSLTQSLLEMPSSSLYHFYDISGVPIFLALNSNTCPRHKDWHTVGLNKYFLLFLFFLNAPSCVTNSHISTLNIWKTVTMPPLVFSSSSLISPTHNNIPNINFSKPLNILLVLWASVLIWKSPRLP